MIVPPVIYKVKVTKRPGKYARDPREKKCSYGFFEKKRAVAFMKSEKLDPAVVECVLYEDRVDDISEW